MVTLISAFFSARLLRQPHLGVKVRYLCMALLLISCFGCAHSTPWPPQSKLVSANQLRQIIDTGHYPKPVNWLYYGTDASFHYFAPQYIASPFDAIGLGDKDGPYKVKKGEMDIPYAFPPSRVDDEPGKGRLIFMRWKPRQYQGQLVYDPVFDFDVRVPMFYPQTSPY